MAPSFRQILASIENILRDLKIRLGLGEIELGLLQILHNAGLGGGDIRGIGLLQGAVAVAHSRIEVGILERGEQLAFGDMSAALDEERL